MMVRVGLLALWVGSLVYGFGFAPPQQPDTFDLIVALATFEWDGINPLLAALFNVMGLWPAIYAAVLLVDGRSQSLPAWPFVVLSFGFGAFALLPYLALRQPNSTFSGAPSPLIKLTESRWLALLLLLSGGGLIGYGLLNGSWSEFVNQWQASRFINVMSLDFCLLSLLFAIPMVDDLARRNMSRNWGWFVLALLPVIGPTLYLLVRSPLVDGADPAPDDSTPDLETEAIVSLDA